MLRTKFLLFILFSLLFAPSNAQVTDNFSDGDFTNNPSWSGDNANWEVLNGELHLNGPAISDTSYLSTPSTALIGATWEFTVRMGFDPSSTSYTRYYLISDSPDLEGPLNGYYVRVGHTADNVVLYSISGTSSTAIISGLNNRVEASNTDYRIRVTNDGLGNWTLESDSAFTGYINEGTAFNNDHTSGTHTGVWTKYIASRSALTWVDSVLIISPPDTDPPLALNLTAISDNEVEVQFSENVDPITALVQGNYIWNGNNPTATPIYVGLDSSRVRLGFPSGSFAVCTSQILDIRNVGDFSSNIMADTLLPFTYFNIGAANFKSVIVNEIMFDTSPAPAGLPAFDYIELYNRGTATVDLQNWTISDGGTAKIITNDSYALCPGEYVTLCGDSSLWTGFGPALQTTSTFPNFNNTGDPVVVKDQNGVVVDSLLYDPNWHTIANSGGLALELINPTDTCALGSANWGSSTHANGGTPGQPNSILNLSPDVTAPSLTSVTVIAANAIQLCFDESLDLSNAETAANYSVDNGLGTPDSAVVSNALLSCVNLYFPTLIDTGTLYTVTASNISDCKGNALSSQTGTFFISGPTPFKDVIFNEVMFEPDSGVTNMPDEEYVELYNRSTGAIEIGGWIFADDVGNGSINSYLLPPGGFVIICDVADTALFSSYGPVTGVNGWPTLNNNADNNIGLHDQYGNLVDTLFFNNDTYQDASKDDGGYSLELINPDDTCSYFGNWIANNDADGGTPAAQNSVYDNTPDVNPPAILSITVTGDSTLQVCFDETMNPATLAQAANYSLSPGLGNPVLAVPIGPANQCVDLSLNAAIDTGTVYQITFTNITDCIGNSVGILADSFLLGGSAAPFQVIINEIMADPADSVGLPELEYLELFNNSSAVISLDGWMIDRGTQDITLPAYNMLPGEYLILCDDDDTASFAQFGNVLASTNSFFSLPENDSLILIDASGTVIDFVIYSEDSYDGFGDKDDGGWSLERVDPGFYCQNLANWRPSENLSGGTPGAQNSVFGTFNDQIPPSLQTVVVLPGDILRVTFDEVMDPGNLLNPLNYDVQDGIGNPMAVTLANLSLTTVDLLLGSSLDTNTIYCLTVTNVQDCPGNTIGANNQACFGIPLAAMAGDLVINEILANPLTGGSDFVELYNVSDKIIDLSSLHIGEVFERGDSIFNSDQISSSQKLLLPQSYICLTADKQFQIDTYEPINPDAIFEMSSFPSYDDASGECVIFNDSGLVIDQFYYEDDFQFPNLDDDNGVSLERHDFLRSTQDADNWHSAASTVNYGTPGYENSQVLVPGPSSEEVWLEPVTFSPDQDGFEDVVSINYEFNTSGWNTRVTVFDHKGRLVRKLKDNFLIGTDAGVFTWDGTDDAGHKVGIGIYVILFETSNPNTGETKAFKLGCVVAEKLLGP